MGRGREERQQRRQRRVAIDFDWRRSSEDFEKLCRFSVPQDPKSLKANPTAALLSKLIDALKNPASASAPHSKPMALKDAKAAASKGAKIEASKGDENTSSTANVAKAELKAELMKEEAATSKRKDKDDEKPAATSLRLQCVFHFGP